MLENADRLADALGIELDLTEKEVPVGGYALDLKGEDKTNEVVLVVENQLAVSDHGHLGQLLTYAAGTKASTVVWITTAFRDEHREALTWLNEHTDTNTHFFGLQLEVVRIGESSPAPLFKVVVQPNEWADDIKSMSVKQASAKTALYVEFWARYLAELKERHPNWTRSVPPKGNACWMSAGVNGCGYSALFTGDGHVRHELYIDRSTAAESRAIFDALLVTAKRSTPRTARR